MLTKIRCTTSCSITCILLYSMTHKEENFVYVESREIILKKWTSMDIKLTLRIYSWGPVKAVIYCAVLIKCMLAISTKLTPFWYRILMIKKIVELSLYCYECIDCNLHSDLWNTVPIGHKLLEFNEINFLSSFVIKWLINKKCVSHMCCLFL